jgi:hypothetical protein
MPLFGEYGLLALHIVVAATSLVAVVLFVCSKPLRFHSTAVCLSGMAWLGLFLVALPEMTKPGSAGDLGAAFGNAVMPDCCGILFGVYHLLLCLALVLQVFRVTSGTGEERTG